MFSKVIDWQLMNENENLAKLNLSSVLHEIQSSTSLSNNKFQQNGKKTPHNPLVENCN